MVTGDPEEESYIEAERAETIQKRIVVLRDVLDHIDLELSATNTADPDTFWNDLDPDIIRVAKKLFEDGHFQKAAFCAFVEVNDHVKQMSSRKTDRSWMGLN